MNCDGKGGREEICRVRQVYVSLGRTPMSMVVTPLLLMPVHLYGFLSAELSFYCAEALLVQLTITL